MLAGGSGGETLKTTRRTFLGLLMANSIGCAFRPAERTLPFAEVLPLLPHDQTLIANNFSTTSRSHVIQDEHGIDDLEVFEGYTVEAGVSRQSSRVSAFVLNWKTSGDGRTGNTCWSVGSSSECVQ